jgi:hypothetical protein
MPEGYLLMSSEARDRSHLIRRTIGKDLSQREAAERLGISRRLLALHFAPAECAAAYLAALRDHVLTHGRPLAFYSDRHGIFGVNAKDAQIGDGKTEFGRVVERLDIGLINALTPQAKGRVERANQTLQDRLIKEMRLCNINSIEATRGFLPGFICQYNEKFGVPPRDEAPAHRPWTQTQDALDETLARREERVLTKALTFSSGGKKYCVKTDGPGTALRGAKVTLHHFASGRLRVYYKQRPLAFTAYGTYPVPDPAEDDVALTQISASGQGRCSCSVSPGPPMMRLIRFTACRRLSVAPSVSRSMKLSNA